MLFQNRSDAGKKLAAALNDYKNSDSVVLGLPRGGVVVGYQIAASFGIPLGVVLVKKISHPENPELAIGAVTSDGVELVNHQYIKRLGIDEKIIKNLVHLAKTEMIQKQKIYKDYLISVEDKTVILVDDGLATGFTAKAAIESIKFKNPKQIILAAPVCSLEAAKDLSSTVTKLICLYATNDFGSVGLWYQDFTRVTDEEAVNLLKVASKNEPNSRANKVGKNRN